MRAVLHRVVFLLVALVATGCASRLHGDVNFDPGQDFSRSQKLAFAKPSDTAEGRQVQQVVQQALVDKGYTFTRREEADLLITTWAGVRVKTATSGWLGSASGSPEGSLMIGFRSRTTITLSVITWSKFTPLQTIPAERDSKRLYFTIQFSLAPLRTRLLCLAPRKSQL